MIKQEKEVVRRKFHKEVNGKWVKTIHQRVQSCVCASITNSWFVMQTMSALFKLVEIIFVIGGRAGSINSRRMGIRSSGKNNGP